jgi:hypothetical protein
VIFCNRLSLQNILASLKTALSAASRAEGAAQQNRIVAGLILDTEALSVQAIIGNNILLLGRLPTSDVLIGAALYSMRARMMHR